MLAPLAGRIYDGVPQQNALPLATTTGMSLLDQFDSLSMADVDGWIASKQEEHLQLDFKTVASAGFGSTDDKRNLAKALSGFANSDGGLIVWGVIAKRNVDGVDCAIGIQPLADVQLAITRLNSLTGEAVSPLVDGVRHRVIGVPASGVAVTIVPVSDAGPHMAKLGEDRYYKRAGDSFYRMEHYDIADMFGRRRRPVLSVEARVVAAHSIDGGGTQTYKGKLILGLRNSGRFVARAPYLALEVDEPYRISGAGVTGSGHEGLPRLFDAKAGSGQRYGGTTDTVVHPGTLLEVASVELQAVASGSRLEMPQPVRIRYAVAAEDFPLMEGTVAVDSDDIASALYPASIYVSKAARLRRGG